MLGFAADGTQLLHMSALDVHARRDGHLAQGLIANIVSRCSRAQLMLMPNAVEAALQTHHTWADLCEA